MFVHNPFQSTAKCLTAKIHQQAKRKIHQPQIGSDLFHMDPGKLFQGFDFDNKAALDQEINTKTLFEINTAIAEIDWHCRATDNPNLVSSFASTTS